MHNDIASQLLEHSTFVFRQQRRLAEAAVQQVDDQQFFHAPGPESNSIAVIVKHVGGNLRSRWTEFLTSDGEKLDRNRDGEFVANESRADIMRAWNEGWLQLESTLTSLTAVDLQNTVTIRGEPHTVTQALFRSLAHASHHAGQIVFLARLLAGHKWETLSIPRGVGQSVVANFWK